MFKDTNAGTTMSFEAIAKQKGLELNLENFRELTGHRFRMTKDQRTRKLTREQAFAEFVGNNSALYGAWLHGITFS